MDYREWTCPDCNGTGIKRMTPAEEIAAEEDQRIMQELFRAATDYSMCACDDCASAGSEDE